MIVVIGGPTWRTGDEPGPDGPAARIALGVAAAGGSVELVGRIGDDPAGDAMLIALARAGVGHVAVLRDPARPTPTAAPTTPPREDVTADDPGTSEATGDVSGLALDAADVELALRYLTSFGVVIVPNAIAPETLAVVADATRYSGAQLIVITDESAADGAPQEATILVSPGDDPDGTFARMVGHYAAALDAGTDPRSAFREAMTTVGGAADRS